MRLLLITNRYPAGSDDTASPFVPHFVGAVRDRGVAVDVLTPRYGVSRDVAEPGSGTRPCSDDESVLRFSTGASAPVGSWNLINPMTWLRLLRFMRHGRQMGETLCAERQYDHILALWALPSGRFAQNLSRRFGIPYSVWCLGSDIYAWARRPLIRGRVASVLRGASHVFGDGEDMCRRIHDWLGIRAVFLPSFRPLDSAGDCKPPMPIEDPGRVEDSGRAESPRFLYLGRLHPAKGVFDLLTAFALVRDAVPGATLRFVGGGPAAAKLRQRATRLGLLRMHDSEPAAVTITGAVRQDEVVRSLTACSCVVIPTRSDSIPLVFTEAVQAMRPVIGTNVGDLGAMIQRYRVGLVTPSTTPGDLARTMIQAAHSPAFSMDGRAELLRLFDPQGAAQTFCKMALSLRPESPAGASRAIVAPCTSP